VTVHTERDGPVLTVTIDRPEARNAVDAPTADRLAAAFRAFDADDELRGIAVGFRRSFFGDLEGVLQRRQ